MGVKPMLYDDVKAQVTAKQAAERYAGLNMVQKGARYWARCPLHEDATPSLMFDEEGRFHCFSCGAYGSAIDFVAAYKRISATEAAQTIARDYSIITDNRKPLESPVKPVKRPDTDNKRIIMYRALCDAKHSAKAYINKRKVEEGEAALDDSFYDAVIMVSYIEGWLDTLESGTDSEAATLIAKLEGVTA